jgi:hypothetical protein
LDLSLDQSAIEFFIGDKPASELECSRQLVTQKEETIFSPGSDKTIQELRLRNQIKYSDKPLCPFVFTNAQLDVFNIWNHIDTLLIKNLLRFQSASSNESSTSINSKISYFSICGYKYALDARLFSI